MCVNTGTADKYLTGSLQCNDGKLNNIDGFGDFYSVNCVLD